MLTKIQQLREKIKQDETYQIQLGKELSAVVGDHEKIKSAIIVVNKHNQDSKSLEDLEVSLDKKVHKLSQKFEAHRELIEKKRTSLNQQEKEYYQSQITHRNKENSTVMFATSTLEYINKRILQNITKKEYQHLMRDKRRCELEIAFAVMPRCSSYGANDLSFENATKFIDEKR